MKLLNSIMKSSQEQRYANAKREFLHYLAWRGGKLFGEIPKGVRREFFCLDPYTWVWHEEWTDQSGKHHAVTTRYDVRKRGILKSQGANSYQRLSPQEESNFRQAAKQYLVASRNELHRLAATR
jgi:hypothetical protein